MSEVQPKLWGRARLSGCLHLWPAPSPTTIHIHTTNEIGTFMRNGDVLLNRATKAAAAMAARRS